MARLICYLKEDWVAKRKIEWVLPVLLLLSIIIQIVTIARGPSTFQLSISIACIYLNVTVLLSTVLSPIRYMDSPLGSLFNTYRVVVGYMPFKKRHHALVKKINQLIEQHGDLPPFSARNSVWFPNHLLEQHIELLELMLKNNNEIDTIKNTGKSPQ